METVLNQAKQLAPRERLLLIQELLLTLEPDGEPLSEAEWNAAWLPELKARAAVYDRGETQSSSWQDVMVRLRASLDTSQSP